MGTHTSHGITQCYLPPGRGDIPVFTPAKAGTQFSDPGGMQCWVDLGTAVKVHSPCPRLHITMAFTTNTAEKFEPRLIFSNNCIWTASILICSRLKAVNLSRPSGRLWLYAGLIGSNNLAGSKQRKGDELPHNGPCCLCASFVFLLMGVSWWMFPSARLTQVVSGKVLLHGRVCVCRSFCTCWIFLQYPN